MGHSDKLMTKPESWAGGSKVQQAGEKLALLARGESMSDPKLPSHVVQDAPRVRHEPREVNGRSQMAEQAMCNFKACRSHRL